MDTDRRDQLMRMFHFVITFLEKNNVPYFLEDGSLLGAVRQGGLIKSDYDVDIVVMTDNIMQFKIVMTYECLKNGFLYYRGPGRINEEGITAVDYDRAKSIWIDIGIRKLSNMVKYGETYWHGGYSWYPLKKCYFEERCYPCRANAIDYLKWCYGDDWREYDKDDAEEKMRIKTVQQELRQKLSGMDVVFIDQ